MSSSRRSVAADATDGVTLRPGTHDDLPRIVELLADDPLGSTRETPGLPLAREYTSAFDEITAQAGNGIIVAEAGGEVIGCLQLTIVPGLSRRGAKRAFVEGVRVAGDYRSRGIGELLMREAIDQARAASCTLVQLTTDRSRGDAHRFYERLGFTASHVGFKLQID